MDVLNNLIQTIPWGSLGDNAVIIIVCAIIIGVLVYYLINYKQNRISLERKKASDERMISKYEHETKQKEIEKYNHSVEVILKDNVSVDNTNVGNVKSKKNSCIRVTLGEGSKISDSKVGNIDA